MKTNPILKEIRSKRLRIRDLSFCKIEYLFISFFYDFCSRKSLLFAKVQAGLLTYSSFLAPSHCFLVNNSGFLPSGTRVYSCGYSFGFTPNSLLCRWHRFFCSTKLIKILVSTIFCANNSKRTSEKNNFQKSQSVKINRYIFFLFAIFSLMVSTI